VTPDEAYYQFYSEYIQAKGDAGNIDWRKIEDCQDIIIRSADPYWCNEFLSCLPKSFRPGAIRFDEIQQVILDSKDPEECYFLAFNVDGSDIEGAGNAILSSKNCEIIRLFVQSLTNRNLTHSKIDKFRKYMVVM
jgi:hypothetical protein